LIAPPVNGIFGNNSMPHALTPRQREYLDFLREYIKENESSPRLEEIADHFVVKPPTAHKALLALHNKGYIYFARDSVSGFFIRLIERAGSAETMVEIIIAGKVNRYGELVEFPEKHGHFASIVQGADPENVFALALSEDIPEANMIFGDWLICDRSKRPQPGDIAILPMSRDGRRFLLCRIDSLTYDKDLESIEASNDYPIPEDLLDTSRDQRFNWSPLAFSESTKDIYWQELEKEGWPTSAIPPELVMGTVLRLTRHLAL
jgi:SOS-response transcriptional repressor LexA